jgi:hypothetical protein
MNRPLRVLFITSLLIISSVFINTNLTIAQVPPPPPPNGGPNNGHGYGGNQPAGPGAPIGGGLELLVVFGAFYAGKKVYTFYKG